VIFLKIITEMSNHLLMKKIVIKIMSKKIDHIISSSQNLDKVKKAREFYFGDHMGLLQT
jgi:hypothetical protein